jgi:hypothetical protein
MNFHPHTRAQWEPIFSALVAYVFGGLFGLGLAAVIDGDKVAVALLWGGMCALFVWVFDHVAWLLIVGRSYGPQPAAPVEDAPEPDLGDSFENTRFMIQRADKTGIWVIQPGCSIEQLGRFAQAICHDELSMSYKDIVITQRIFQQEEYRSFVGWLVSQRFAIQDGSKGEAKLTDIGKDFVNSVFARGITIYSPATA